MKLAVALCLVSAISASKIPIRFNFKDGNPNLMTVSQCEGHDDDVMQVLGGSTPEEICMPGTMLMDTHINLKEDMPTDWIMHLDLKKLEPFPMKVPCLNGIGSCPYELCPIIVDHPDIFCPHFPPSQPCGCPLLSAELDMKGIEVQVPDFGAIIGSVMEGKYEAKATFFSKASPDKILGCMDLTFSLKQCDA